MNESTDFILLINDNLLSDVKNNRFASTVMPNTALSTMSAHTIDDQEWDKFKQIVEKIHKLVCGHVSYTDF